MLQNKENMKILLLIETCDGFSDYEESEIKYGYVYWNCKNVKVSHTNIWTTAIYLTNQKG